MNRDPDERAQPEGGQAPDEFDAIVAHWQREGGVPVWPTDGRRAVGALFEPVATDPTAIDPPLPGAGGGTTDPTATDPTPTGPPGPASTGLPPVEPPPADPTRAGEHLPPTGSTRRQNPLPGTPQVHRPPTGPPPGSVAPEDEHFVPPEPPPLPRLGPPAMVGLFLLALGLVLITAPGWVGVPLAYGLPLGLLALAAGLGWLVLRLWPDPPSAGQDDTEDDGAIV